ncbi:TonB-dependent receptor plug domain-containing protein [Piscinibacter sp.]|uniref:TonB-dependent receptor plug domain-containing protein n=1 Tax=Piscinibacter sp. TaxID=1903157 RepID=UPI002D80B6C5|nr:TonB-dependent receptor [Albitalea sp.]
MAAGTVAVHAASEPADLASADLDTLLDVEISGASKFTLRMSESASSATVITSEQMRALGHRTLADALRSIRGVVVSSDRTYSYLGVRGFSAPGDYNTRILLLVDGNRVNDTVFDQAFLGSEFPLDLDLVERVEFIPGQGSAVHGANALFGVVNVVTRRPDPAGTQQAAVTLASGALRQFRVTGSRLLGRTSVLLSATTLREGGHDVYYGGFDAPETNHGISRRTDHERNDQLFAKISSGTLSATLIHADRSRGLSAIPDVVFNDPRTLYRDTQTLADVALQQRLDTLSDWKLRLYAGSYSFRGDYIVDYPPLSLNRDGAQSRWWGVETSVFTEHIDAHRIVVGADLQISPTRDQTNVDVWPEEAIYLDDHRTSRRVSLFAEDQWTVSPAISLTAGARLDRIGGMASQVNPRLGAVWRPGAKWVLKLIHGTAYRPPNAYETWYATPAAGVYKANPALREERVRGTELAIDHRPDASTRWTLSAYANRGRSLIVQTLDEADDMMVYENLGLLRARGVELEFERVWSNGAQLRANYSRQQVNDRHGDGFDAAAPAHLGKLIAVLPVRAGWTLGAETVLVGERGGVPGYGVSNLTLSRSLPSERGRFSLGVQDVFDRHAGDPGSDSVLQPVAPHDGRTVRLKLELEF